MATTTTSLLSIMNNQVLSVMQQSDDFFRFAMASLIFFMQFGFGLFEAGISRSSFTIKRTLMKNFLCTVVSMISFWLFGYALAFGGSNVFGGGQQFWAWSNLSPTNYAHFWLQFAYAATSASIAVSALTERCHMAAYVIFTFLWTGFAYPIIAHWVWHPQGWLTQGYPAWNAAVNGTVTTVPFYDAAGSGVVHMSGGIAALFGAILLGARTDRFSKVNGTAVAYRPHSSTLIMIGGAIISLGLVVFNGTGVEAINYQANLVTFTNGYNYAQPQQYMMNAYVAVSMVNTVISAGVSAFSVYFIMLIAKMPISLIRIINGGISGMAAISCVALWVYPWAAAIFGVFAGLGYLFWCYILQKLRVDDVTDSFAVFCGGGGTWGLIATAFLHNTLGIVWLANGVSGYFLAWQLVGICAIWAWAGGCSVLIFGMLRLFRLLRIREEVEMQGTESYVAQQTKQTMDLPTFRSGPAPGGASSIYGGSMLNEPLPRLDAQGGYGQANAAFH